MEINRTELIKNYKSVCVFVTNSLPHLFIGADIDMVRLSLTISVESDYFRVIYREDEFAEYISKQLPYGNYSWLVLDPLSLA